MSKKYVTGKTYFGVVKDSISKKIKMITGIDVSGRKHDIRHMLKEHGNPAVESKKGQIAITEKDIKKIPDIISNPTNITTGTDNRLGKTIRYIKKYNDNSTTVVEVVPSNSKSLIIKTMWKKPSTLTNNIKVPSSTSETKGSDISSTFDDNISQNSKTVKIGYIIY